MDNKKHEQTKKKSAGMAPLQRQVMCFVGVKSCGCVVAATVIDTGNAKYISEDVKEFKSDGLKIEYMSVEDARIKLTRCKCNETLPMFVT